MKWPSLKVDCEYLSWNATQRSGIGGQSSITRMPVCLKPNSPNNPPDMDAPFATKCGGCAENNWREEGADRHGY